MTSVKQQRHRLVHELQIIANDMKAAMFNADTSYVAKGRPTLAMSDALGRYYDWARRASEAGL